MVKEVLKKKLLRKRKRVDYFTSLLNADCIYLILDLLPLDDLCSVGSTSKKLQILAGDQFKHKYPEKIPETVKILKVFTEPKERHVKCFIHCVPNIEIISCNGTNVSYYLDRDFGENLKSVKFSNTDFGAALTKMAINLMENVEMADFNECSGDPNFLGELLDNCSRLKHLRVNLSYMNELPCRTVAGLESFEFNIYNKENADNFLMFLQHNQSIKRLTCSFEFLFNLDHFKTSCTSIIARCKNIEEQYYDFKGDFELSLIKNELMVLDEAQPARKVSVKLPLIDVHRFSTLASIKSLSALYLHEVENYPKSFGSISPFVHMKTLYLMNAQLDKEYLTTLVGKFPNLEELQLVHASCVSVDFLLPLAMYLAKLKKIAIIQPVEFESSDLLRLDIERRKLDGACQLKIYLDQDAVGSKRWYDRIDSSDYRFVQIKLIKVTQQKSAGVVNPFHPYSVDEGAS